jgi:hypothetical protein
VQTVIGHAEALPGSTTVVDQALTGQSPESPSWTDEPVRFISNAIAVGLAVLGGLSAVVLALTDVVPDSMSDELAAVSGGILVATAVLTKLAGVFTRSKVWSPASVASATREALYRVPPDATAVIVPTVNGPVVVGGGEPGPAVTENEYEAPASGVSDEEATSVTRSGPSA